ncbi:hypothetical protein evm_004643 [Chilo suppressalis]|nr:hypothetical protein evm_004643 [Chilo suppressalis]
MICFCVICACCIFGRVLAEVNMTVLVLHINGDKTTETFECSRSLNELYVYEFDNISLNLVSSSNMHYFSCYNGEGSFTLNGNNHRNMTSAVFQVKDTLAGLWNCSFYTERDEKYIEGESYHNYYQSTCKMTLYIEDYILWTIFNAIDKTELLHNDGAVYHYKEGDHLTIFCTHYSSISHGSTLSIYHFNNTRTLLSNSYELNNVNASVILSRRDNNSSIYCEYYTFHEHEQQLQDSVLVTITMDLVLVPDEPPEMSLAGGNGKFYETSYSNYAYEGPTDDTITIYCTKKETKGSLHWDYCFNIADGICTYMKTVKNNQSQTIKLYNFTFTPELNGTDVKCIYTSPVGVQSKSTISLNLTQEKHQNNGSALIVIGYVSAVLGSVCIGALSLYFVCRRRCRGTTLNNTINRPLPEVPPRSVDETNNGIELGEHVYGTIDNAEGDYSYVIIDRRNPEDYGIPR